MEVDNAAAGGEQSHTHIPRDAERRAAQLAHPGEQLTPDDDIVQHRLGGQRLKHMAAGVVTGQGRAC